MPYLNCEVKSSSGGDLDGFAKKSHLSAEDGDYEVNLSSTEGSKYNRSGRFKKICAPFSYELIYLHLANIIRTAH